jgi:PEP-CTERM motif
MAISNDTHNWPVGALALAMLTLAWVPAHGAQGVVGVDLTAQAPLSGHAEMSNFRYTLVDLDLADGLAPSITFLKSTTGNASSIDGLASADGGFRWLPPQPGQVAMSGEFPTRQALVFDRATQGQASVWLPLADIRTSSGDGSSANTIGVSGLESSVVLSTEFIAAAAQPNSTVDEQGKVQMIASAGGSASVGFVGSDYQLQGMPGVEDPLTGDVTYPDKRVRYVPGANTYLYPWLRFLLSPNTAVVFEGDLQAQAFLDIAPTPGYADASAAGSVSSLAMFQVFRDLPKDGQRLWNTWEEATKALDVTYVEARAIVSAGYSTSPPLIGTQASELTTKSFSAEIRNDSASDMAGYMYGQASTYGAVEWAAAAVVPEPATYALMGLGLMGIAGARRRPSQA